MKAIEDLKLLEKLQPILEGRETEYVSADVGYWYEEPTLSKNIPKNFHEWGSSIKTLTLEEALDLLPKHILYKQVTPYHKQSYSMQIYCSFDWDYYIDYNFEKNHLKYTHWKTPLEAIEKMLNFLIDNNLLTKEKVWK